jgi:hypothetical protein
MESRPDISSHWASQTHEFHCNLLTRARWLAPTPEWAATLVGVSPGWTMYALALLASTTAAPKLLKINALRMSAGARADSLPFVCCVPHLAVQCVSRRAHLRAWPLCLCAESSCPAVTTVRQQGHGLETGCCSSDTSGRRFSLRMLMTESRAPTSTTITIPARKKTGQTARPSRPSTPATS